MSQPEPSNWEPRRTETDGILQRAEITDCKLIPSGSNYVFLVSLADLEAGAGLGVYKPQRGEAPLWDFPEGTLYRRERASYVLAADLGWDFIPPTVIRDGPYGVGSVQLYISNNPRDNFFTLRDSHEPALRRIAVFDAIANNADRKGGHCLLGGDNHVWGIDHGLTFNVSDKLRTVIWDYSEEPIAQNLLADVRALAERLDGNRDVCSTLRELLDESEIEALRERVERLLRRPYFPEPRGRRAVPWPPI